MSTIQNTYFSSGLSVRVDRVSVRRTPVCGIEDTDDKIGIEIGDKIWKNKIDGPDGDTVVPVTIGVPYSRLCYSRPEFNLGAVDAA